MSTWKSNPQAMPAKKTQLQAPCSAELRLACAGPSLLSENQWLYKKEMEIFLGY